MLLGGLGDETEGALIGSATVVAIPVASGLITDAINGSDDADAINGSDDADADSEGLNSGLENETETTGGEVASTTGEDPVSDSTAPQVTLDPTAPEVSGDDPNKIDSDIGEIPDEFDDLALLNGSTLEENPDIDSVTGDGSDIDDIGEISSEFDDLAKVGEI